MEKMTIEKIDGRWTVNGKIYKELTPNEIQALASFIKEFEFCLTTL